MSQPENTDGKFWAYVQVAQRPDSTGRHRASIMLFSALYDWTPDALAETLERANAQNPSRLLPPMSREQWDFYHADADNRTGYCEPDEFADHGAEAYMTMEPWIMRNGARVV